jgi:hypothetical protein
MHLTNYAINKQETSCRSLLTLVGLFWSAQFMHLTNYAINKHNAEGFEAPTGAGITDTGYG